MAAQGIPDPMNSGDKFGEIIHAFNSSDMTPEQEAERENHIEDRARTVAILQIMADQEREEQGRPVADHNLGIEFYHRIFGKEDGAGHIFSPVHQEVEALFAEGRISQEERDEHLAVAHWIQRLTTLLPFSERVVELVADDTSENDEQLLELFTDDLHRENDPEGQFDEPKIQMQAQVEATAHLSQSWKDRINKVIDALREGDSIFSLDEAARAELLVNIAIQESVDEETDKYHRLARKALREALESYEGSPSYPIAIAELSNIAVERHRCGRRAVEEGDEENPHVTLARTSLRKMGLQYDSLFIEAAMNGAVAALRVR